MNKLFIAFLLFTFCGMKAQYGTLNSILDLMEERKGINQNLKDISIDDKKFVLVKDFEDHTERNFIVIKGNNATYIEVFDDKQTGESTSNVFSGDVVRSNRNIISVRCNLLEGKKIPVPVTKTFLLTKQKNILYLLDANSKERWIDENSFGKEK